MILERSIDSSMFPTEQNKLRKSERSIFSLLMHRCLVWDLDLKLCWATYNRILHSSICPRSLLKGAMRQMTLCFYKSAYAMLWLLFVGNIAQHLSSVTRHSTRLLSSAWAPPSKWALFFLRYLWALSDYSQIKLVIISGKTILLLQSRGKTQGSA